MRRLIAFIVDAIFVSVIMLAFFPFGLLGWGPIVIFLIAGVIWWIYSALFEAVIGGTIGKKLLSLHVVALDGMMDLPRALVRNASKIFPFGIGIILDFLIGAASQGDPRQRYLDRVART